MESNFISENTVSSVNGNEQLSTNLTNYSDSESDDDNNTAKNQITQNTANPCNTIDLEMIIKEEEDIVVDSTLVSNPELSVIGETFKTETSSKCGSKRTLSQRDFEKVSNPPVASDSAYIMRVVEEELKAVQKTLEASTKDTKPHDSNDESGVSSDGESSSESVSESSSSESSSDSSSEESAAHQRELRKIIQGAENDEDKIQVGPPHTKDEILIKDLPLEPVIEIELDENANMVHIGNIAHSVETMVVVQALPHTPALDIETLLFLENRTCIGRIFETFGPVQSPFYSLRFSSAQDITEKGVAAGLKVFFVPEDQECTKLVFTAHLRKLKGSDASWKHDQEPPVELIEYSDDEEEAQAKAKKKKDRKNQKPAQGQEQAMEGVPKEQQQKQEQRNVPQRNTWQGRGRGMRNIPRGPPPSGWQGHPSQQGPHQGWQGPPPLFRGPMIYQGAGPRHYRPPPPPGPYQMGPTRAYTQGPGHPSQQGPPQGFPYPMGPRQPFSSMSYMMGPQAHTMCFPMDSPQPLPQGPIPMGPAGPYPMDSPQPLPRGPIPMGSAGPYPMGPPQPPGPYSAPGQPPPEGPYPMGPTQPQPSGPYPVAPGQPPPQGPHPMGPGQCD